VRSIGMSVHNTRATLEGMFGKKTPFERTPKHRMTDRSTVRQIGRYRTPMSWSVAGEVVLAACAVASVVTALRLHLYGAVPFQMLFVTGYVMVATYSLRHLRFTTTGVPRADVLTPAQPVSGPLAQPTSTAAAASAA
jgi:hypothetical protein